MSEKEQLFKELPKVHTTYANVIKSLIPLGDNHASSLPDVVYGVEKLIIDESNLQDYRNICGFVDDGRVPATYFAVLSQTLQMNIMAKEDFPFAMLGLVHLYNKVVQYRPIFDSEIASMSVSLGNLSAHDKGQQFDFMTEVKVGDELVWQGVSTYLSRQKKSKEERERQRQLRQNQPPADTPAPVGKLLETIDVAEDIGRRYAFVSGDFNLIHLHPLSAKAFGFPRAIAHGMWSKARCLSQFHELPKAYSAEVWFHAPIFLPSKVRFIGENTDNGKTFGLYGENNDKAHMTGSISYL